MQWTRPDFQEITLNMEVTAYVNTDDDVITPERGHKRAEPATAPALSACQHESHV